MAEGFEQIEALDLAEGEAMNNSDYAQVIFDDIAESYAIDVNIVCKYTVTPLLQATKSDWVGVYKVGWTSSKNHVYYEWAKLPESVSEGKAFGSEITFKANTLPGDDGEFYQFCYVTSMGQVRGASTPFQFKRPSASEQYVEIEDFEDDIMVIKSKTHALEDELCNVKRERQTLVKGHERMEHERESLLKKLVASEKKLTTEKQQREAIVKNIKSLESKLDSQQAESKDLLLVHDSLRDKINKLSEEKMTLSRKLDEKDSYTRSLQEKVKSLINEKDSLMGKNKMLEEEKDLYKSHFSSSENTLQGHLKEIDDLQKQLRQEEEACVDLRGQISTLGQELELTINKLNQQERMVQQDKEQIQMLTEQLKCNEEKIEALEQCKLNLGEELETLNLALTDVSDKWEQSKNEAHKYKEQLKLLEHVHENQTVSAGEQLQELNMRLKHKTEENEQLQEESVKLKSELGEMAKKANTGEDDTPIAFMKRAHHELTARLNRTVKEKEELQNSVQELLKRKASLESSSLEMKRENEDLKERLSMGHDEYRDKSVECQRIRKELKKLQRKVLRSCGNSVSHDSLSDSSTQTKQSTGDKHTETDPKCESEQTTQTKVKEEKENQTQTRLSEKECYTQTAVAAATPVLGKETETQTNVTEKETETQTSVAERETETQTSVPEMEQSGDTTESFADLTNPELLCQLDDLGKELATRNERKQKYKELFQQEKQKCAYLRNHYYEELEQKDQQIQTMQHELESSRQQIVYLESCLRENQTKPVTLKIEGQETAGQTQAHATLLYPPQTCCIVPQTVPSISPVLTQPSPSAPSPRQPLVSGTKPMITHQPAPSSGSVPPEIPPRNKKAVIYPPQRVPPAQGPSFPAFYDKKTITPHTGDVPTTSTVQSSHQSSGSRSPCLTLDPLQTKESAPSDKVSQSYDNLGLLPPLQPELLPTAKLAKVLGAVTGPISESRVTEEQPQFMGPGWECPGVPMLEDLPVIKTPPEPVQGPPAVSEEGAAAVETQAMRSEPGESSGQQDGGQASGAGNEQGTEEQEEERFFDAQDAEQNCRKECPMCEMSFTPETSDAVVITHIEMHFTNTKDCPMCGKKFSSDTDEQVYTNHVNRHFDDSAADGDDSDGGFTQV